MKDHIAKIYCSFCSKCQDEVKVIVAGPAVFICNECVEFCMVTIEEKEKVMTKNIRIENADASNWKVQVEVWDVGYNGTPDVLAKIVDLNYPTAMATEYITAGRYLKIKENGQNSN